MADRSVSVSLRAKVAEFIAGMNAAKNSTQDLSRKMTETGASADQMRRRLEAATRALPKITIDADSTPAEIKFAQLRRELESLSEKRIGIDVDAATAMAQIRTIEQELAQLERDETNVNVKADIGTALAELRAMQGEVNRLDGQTARVNVNADVAGALANIALVGAALAALPAAVTIGAGVAGLGAAFGAAAAGAGAFGAVAIPAMGRVNEAVKEMGKSTGAAGGATKSAGQAAATAAQQALQLEQAERRVSDAKKAAKQAEEDLTRARQDAKRAIQDLNLSLKDGILSERDAALAVEEAQVRLNETLADPKATQLQRERAQLDYDQAVQRLEDQQVRTKRLQEDTKKANKEGVEGSDQVRAAKDKQAKSEQAIIDAQKQLKLALLQQKAAMDSAGGAAGGMASKFGALSKQEQQMAKDLKGFQDGYVTWQRSLEGDVFPAIKGGLDLVTSQLPRISPLVKTAAGAFVGLEKDAKKALTDPFWDEFLTNLNKEMPGAITGLGHTAGNVFKGIAGVIDAVLPHSGSLIDAIEGGSKKFADWGVKLKDSPDFKAFVAWVKENAPKVAELIGNVAISAGHIVSALAPFGVANLGGLGLLAKITAGMSEGQIQGVAIAVAAIYTAVKVGGAINAGLGALETLNKRIDTAGSTASTAKGKLSGFAGMLGAGGPWGLAIGAGITAIGLFAAAQAEAKKKVDDLATALDNSTGAITKQARDSVMKDLIDDGTLKRAKDLGLNLKDVTDAALGNEDAIKRVNNALLTFAGQGDSFHPKVRAMGDATKTLSGDALLLQQRLIGSNGTLADAREKLSLAAEASGRSLTAQRLLTEAYGNAKTALHDANGKLDINAQMTDKEKDAVKRAQDAFGGLLDAVGKNAKATFDLTGKTGDSTAAVLTQIPKLMDLAGSSTTAKNKIYDLAKMYGISKKDADKAAESADGLRKMLAKLKSPPPIIITLEERYKQAKKTEEKRNSADGNLFHYFANGAENHVAQIAPAGAMRVWAEPETGGEAYIPLASSKRARSEQILAAVAGEFDMQLMPKKLALIAMANGGLVAGGSTPVFSAGAASGGLTVSIDNLGSMTASLDAASKGLNERLAGATGTLIGTLGGGGTLTKQVIAVGKVADNVASTSSASAVKTSTSTAKLSAEITKLTAAITKLTAAVAKAGATAKTTTTTTTKTTSAPKPKAKSADPNDVTYDRNPPAKKKATKPDPNDATYDRNPPKPKPKPTNQVDGSLGGGSGSIVGAASYAGASAALMDASERIGAAFGSVMAGSASRSLPINGTGSGGTNSLPSRRSAPQMGNPAAYGGAPYSAGAAQSGSLAGRLAHDAAGGGSKGSSPTIHIENYHPPDGASPRLIAEDLNFIGRRS